MPTLGVGLSAAPRRGVSSDVSSQASAQSSGAQAQGRSDLSVRCRVWGRWGRGVQPSAVEKGLPDRSVRAVTPQLPPQGFPTACPCSGAAGQVLGAVTRPGPGGAVRWGELAGPGGEQGPPFPWHLMVFPLLLNTEDATRQPGQVQLGACWGQHFPFYRAFHS